MKEKEKLHRAIPIILMTELSCKTTLTLATFLHKPFFKTLLRINDLIPYRNFILCIVFSGDSTDHDISTNCSNSYTFHVALTMFRAFSEFTEFYGIL